MKRKILISGRSGCAPVKMKQKLPPPKIVRYKNFQLQPQHLRRLREIRKLRRAIDPGMNVPAMGKWTR